VAAYIYVQFALLVIFCLHNPGHKSQKRYLLAVVCRDLGEDVNKWSRADVVVDVAPPNDNPPHFERQLYECDVTADTGSAVDDVITTVKAIDVDDGVSGQVLFTRRCFYLVSNFGIFTSSIYCPSIITSACLSVFLSVKL